MLKIRVDHHESVDEKTELKIRLCNEIVARKSIDFYEQIDFIFVRDHYSGGFQEEEKNVLLYDFVCFGYVGIS